MNSGPGGSNYQCQIPSERIGTEDINKWNLNSVNSFGTKNSFVNEFVNKLKFSKGQQHQMNDFSAMDHGSKWNDSKKIKNFFVLLKKWLRSLKIGLRITLLWNLKALISWK